MIDLSQRTVKKECQLSEDAWYDARKWAGMANREDNREALELHCHSAMAAATPMVVAPSIPFNAANIQTLVDRRFRNYRVYVTWCEHQDLDDVIRLHRQAGTRVPKPFIWYVAKILASVALAMECGHANPALPGSMHGWEEIVHR